MLALRLDDELADMLARAAAHRRLSKSELVRQALRAYLAEDELRAALLSECKQIRAADDGCDIDYWLLDAADLGDAP